MRVCDNCYDAKMSNNSFNITHTPRFPLYYEIKIGFVLWLVLPITEVSTPLQLTPV